MTDHDDLMQEFLDGRVVPVVGSGVSLAVKVDGKSVFPSWCDLLLQMADEIGDEDDAAVVRTHCRKNRWYKAAAEAFEYLRKAGFFKVMRERFDIPKPDEADWSLPDAIWRLQPPLIVTTNYDNVLMWRKPESRLLFNDQPAELAELYRAADASRPFVWHLHGHISRAESLILAPLQYEAFYGNAAETCQQYRAATDQLRALLTNWTLLFIGFGMQDAYVMQLLADVFATFAHATRPHFALMKSGDVDTGKLWSEHNVRVIEYADHGQPLIDKLDELVTAAKNKPDLEDGTSLARRDSRRQPVVPPVYTDWLAGQSSQDVELSGLRPKHGQAVTLRNIYVPVITGAGDVAGSGETRARQRAFAIRDEDRAHHQLLQSLIADQSLYVSGPPGSGKTTFCRWLTLAVCQGELPPHPIAPPDAFQETFPQPLRGRLPLLIRLREFWQALPLTGSNDELTWAELECVLEQWILRKNFPGLDWSVVKDHLDAGAALLIFDGADEVPLTDGDAARATQPRKLLLAGLADAVGHWNAAGNRVLVTSRPYGLSDAQRERLGLAHAPLSELPPELQRLLVRRWFHCLRKDASEAQAASDELWSDVAARPEISQLAANPLLLTAMCIVYGEHRKLPQDEFDLYDRIVDTVLFNRYPEQSSEAAAARSRLCVIAHGMHTGEELGEPREQPRPEATVDEIERMLQFYQDNRPGTEVRKLLARDAREDLLSRSGLLLPQGDAHRAAFYHFTFQDFLAAERLYDLHAEQLSDVFRQRGRFAEWRKALDLLYGALLHKRSTPDQAIRLLTEQIQELTPDDLLLGVVLGDCLRVLRGQGQGLDEAVQQQFVDFCVRAVTRESPLPERVVLALALGEIGDPRVADDLQDPRAWVEVVPGDYQLGDESLAKELKAKYSWDNACLPEVVTSFTDPFQLTKYPVTNGQFRRFIDAGGYENQTLWDDSGWRWRENEQVVEPVFWRDPKWNGETQPVVGVSWWEADAFCRWAGCRLPTEHEWEAAARSRQARSYPWEGDWRDGICNSSEADLNVTTPVGIFPQSVADCGAQDMAGNVWEWCSDPFDSAQAHDPDTGRVLRGGSWYGTGRDCRSAIRFVNLPVLRVVNIGFRAART